MSEQQPTPASATPAEPKSNEPNIEVTKLQQEVQQLRSQLVDPGYIEYLATKTKQVAKTTSPTLLDDDLRPEDIDKLPNSKLLKLAEQKLGKSVMESLRTEFANEVTPLRNTVQDLLAYIEVQEVKSRYSDFDSLKDDVVKVLQSAKNDMSIEDAYRLVKYDRSIKEAPKQEPKKDEGKSSSEKPNQATPPAEPAPKTYKDEHEAGMAAARAVMEKYGLSGSTI